MGITSGHTSNSSRAMSSSTSEKDGTAMDGSREVVGRYSGYMHADAYSAHDRRFDSRDFVEVGCMTDERRKLFEALPYSPEQEEPALKIPNSTRSSGEHVKAGSVSSTGNISASGRRHPKRCRATGSLNYGRTRCQSPRSNERKSLDHHAYALGLYLEDGQHEIDCNRYERAIRKVAGGETAG